MKGKEYYNRANYVDEITGRPKPVEIILIMFLAAAVFLATAYVIITYRSSKDKKMTVFPDSDVVLDMSVINSAAKEDFMAVKGIGNAKASAIITFRESLGGFGDVRQMIYLDGISVDLVNAIIQHFYGEEYYITSDYSIIYDKLSEEVS